MKLKEIKALVLESEKTGRPIQYRSDLLTAWRTAKPDDDLAFIKADHYRVAPEAREYWFRPDQPHVPVLATGCNAADREEIMQKGGYIRLREVLEGDETT